MLKYSKIRQAISEVWTVFTWIFLDNPFDIDQHQERLGTFKGNSVSSKLDWNNNVLFFLRLDTFTWPFIDLIRNFLIGVNKVYFDHFNVIFYFILLSSCSITLKTTWIVVDQDDWIDYFLRVSLCDHFHPQVK